MRAGETRTATATTACIATLVGCILLCSARPPVAAAAETPDEPPNTCIACHNALPEPLNLAVAAMQRDIHAQKGLSCVDCHGGDPTAMDETSMAPEKGFRGKPQPQDVPEFCGRCHSDGAYMRRFNVRLPTDQLQQYRTSVHGRRLADGDQKVATCISCHGAHGILPPGHAESPVFPANIPATCGHCHSNAAYMAEYHIPTDQQEKYERSVHAEMLLVRRDFSAPACNDCHGNHGAFPPGVTSIAEVCGQCHANNAALFVQSPHKGAFDKLGLAECVVCHSNHEIHAANDGMLGGHEGTVCRRCHEPGSAGHAAAVTMRDAIERLKVVMTRTETLLATASNMGMEVSEEQYAYREGVRPRLIQARTDVHRADPALVVHTIEEGITAAAASQTSAETTLAEAQARRRNLLFPLLLIVILMVLLYAKLRQLERPTRSHPK